MCGAVFHGTKVEVTDDNVTLQVYLRVHENLYDMI